MVKVFSGKEFKAPRGSLRSLRVSSPVLVMVVMTLKFSSPSTLTSGVEALIVRLGVAETTTANATTVKTEGLREEENIVVKAVGISGLKGPGLSSLSVLPIAQSSFTSRFLSQLGSIALPEKDCYETKFGDIVKTPRASPKIASRRSDTGRGLSRTHAW